MRSTPPVRNFPGSTVVSKNDDPWIGESFFALSTPLLQAIDSVMSLALCPHQYCHKLHNTSDLSRRPSALPSSPSSVIIPLLCHRPPALSSPPCSVIMPYCHHPPALSSSPCSVIIPPLRSYPKRQPPPSSLVGYLIFPSQFSRFPNTEGLHTVYFFILFLLERRSGRTL